MKIDNLIRQRIISLFFQDNLSMELISKQTNKSKQFIERVIVKHYDFSKKSK